MNASAALTQWECSVDMLNQTIFRKYQHASLYNPAKNQYLCLEKKLANKQVTKSFHGVQKKYKLPLTELKQNRKPFTLSFHKNSENKTKQKNIQKLNTIPKTIIHDREPKLTTNSNKSQNSETKVNINQISEQDAPSKLSSLLQKFNKILFQSKLGERDKYFSYSYNLIIRIFDKVQSNQDKQNMVSILLEDLSLIMDKIVINKTTNGVINEVGNFKKSQNYFEFKTTQIRILFHILAAQVQICQGNAKQAISQIQFCEYHSRRENIQNLVLGFLWESINLNISLLKYDQADESLRNLLEMAVIYRNKKVIGFGLQKISMVYYYRGNSVMGYYYMQKVQQGLSPFEAEIYYKQYDANDQIKRLQSKLFNIPYQKVTKRKNNPKFEADAWRQAKQQYEKQSYASYMIKTNKMLKNSDSANNGKRIKRMAASINSIGEFKKFQTQCQSLNVGKQNKYNYKMNQKLQIKKKKRNGNYRAESQLIEGNWGNNTNLGNGQRKGEKQQSMDNVTYVIKTHLSMNRQNSKVGRLQRWKKFTTFLYTLQKQLRKTLCNLERASFVLGINSNNNNNIL